MSADNWAVCPRCRQRAKDKCDEAISAHAQALREAYGKVSPDEYADLAKNQPEKFDEDDMADDFREDYEVGVYYKDGAARFCCDYSGECEKCGFTINRREDYAIELTPKETP